MGLGSCMHGGRGGRCRLVEFPVGSGGKGRFYITPFLERPDLLKGLLLDGGSSGAI